MYSFNLKEICIIRNPALTVNPLISHPQVRVVENDLLQVKVPGQQAAARGAARSLQTTNNSMATNANSINVYELLIINWSLSLNPGNHA